MSTSDTIRIVRAFPESYFSHLANIAEEPRRSHPPGPLPHSGRAKLPGGLSTLAGALSRAPARPGRRQRRPAAPVFDEALNQVRC